ncbi:MAG: hydroxyisourate hydrolase [Steroidobacteraceae bacterium]
MGQLTTHVLDISTGLPAGGVRIELHERLSEGLRLLTATATGADGRVSAPLLSGAQFKTGSYLLTFHTASRGVKLPQPGVHRACQHRNRNRCGSALHVPLLIAPWSYSVYRGG